MTENTKKCHVLAPTLEAVGAMVFGVSVITIPVYNENFKKVIEKTLGEVEKLSLTVRIMRALSQLPQRIERRH